MARQATMLLLLAAAVGAAEGVNTTAVERCELRCDDLFSDSFLPNMRTGCRASCAPVVESTGQLLTAAECLKSCLVRFSPNSGATLDERGGCTTGCALNSEEASEGKLATTVAEIRAEEAARALTEAQILNMSLTSLKKQEDARAVAEEEALDAAVAAITAAEDARAEAEAEALKAGLDNLAAEEDARAAGEKEELDAAISAERAFEDERAADEAKQARQQAQREKKRLADVKAELTDVSQGLDCSSHC